MLFLVSCHDKEKIRYEDRQINREHLLIRKTYDKHSNLFKEEQLSKDLVRNGFYKEYMDNRIKCSGYYSRDNKDSSWYYFDLAEDTIRKENWFGGKMVGEQFQYYIKSSQSSAATLYKYAFNNLSGKRIFDMSFDLGSKIKEIKGVPLYLAYNSSNVKVNNDFELICLFGVPPSYSYALTITEWDINEKMITSQISLSDTTTDVENLYFGKKYLKVKKYTKKGTYDWKANFLMKDSSNNVLIHDTLKITIKVY